MSLECHPQPVNKTSHSMSLTDTTHGEIGGRGEPLKGFIETSKISISIYAPTPPDPGLLYYPGPLFQPLRSSPPTKLEGSQFWARTADPDGIHFLTPLSPPPLAPPFPLVEHSSPLVAYTPSRVAASLKVLFSANLFGTR